MYLKMIGKSLFLLSMISITACDSQKLGQVSGKVNLNGAPLSEGVITFIPANGAAKAEYVTNGEYKIADIPFGTCKVTVTPKMEQASEGASKTMKPTQVDPTAAQKTGGAKGKGSGPQIPMKYQEDSETDLSVTVDKSEVVYNVEMKP